MAFDQLTLPNGLRIIGERIDHFRSVSVGLWLGAGSQYERPDEGGVSHFLEHMVFKGTKTRSARQIAEEMDAVGGQLNAFTAKECTCFYAKVVDEHLPLAVDVICDLAVNPVFDPAEMEKEKGVVIEEIAMAEDTPEDLVHEMLMTAYYGDQSVARPILGTEARISSFTRDDLISYWQRMYRPQNAVLAIAGHYDWEQVQALARKHLGDWDPAGFEKIPCVTQPAQPTRLVRTKDIEQVHICMGFPGLKIGDEKGFEYSIFNSVFGGAMSSRLFQTIREESGLAYSVYSYPNAYTDTGMLSIYAAANSDAAETVEKLILEQADCIAREGITPEEFAMTREQLKASYILGLESTSARMQSAGRRMLLLNDTRTESDIIQRINQLRLEDVNAIIHEVLTAPHATSIVSPR